MNRVAERVESDARKTCTVVFAVQLVWHNANLNNYKIPCIQLKPHPLVYPTLSTPNRSAFIFFPVFALSTPDTDSDTVYPFY